MKCIIAVLDIGKTNIKLCALACDSGDALTVVKRNNIVVESSSPYPHVDVEGIWSWYCSELQKMSAQFNVKYLCCTTHGATVVCLSDGRLVFPIYDYESNFCEQSNEAYASVRPPYNETLSPALGVGLNAGRQLHWLSQIEPATFQQVDTILMYPQYWAWRLTGIAVSEVTSLGCHTDLWQPLKADYSSLVDRMGWSELFPPLRAAGESLGSVLTGVRNELGLSSNCRVINGIHDSNASLVPYLLNESPPFTVISTGTWVVIANVGSAFDDLSEEDDMLSNVNAFGESVPCMRFMGGREWDLLKGTEEGRLHDIENTLKSDVFFMPCFADQGGPFRHSVGEVVGPIDLLNEHERATLASVYCALVTDFCLSRIESRGKIIVEGSFAANTVFLAILQGLRAGQKINVSNDTTGTTIGAARLIEGCEWPHQELIAVDYSQQVDHENVLAYHAHWKDLLSSRM